MTNQDTVNALALGGMCSEAELQETFNALERARVVGVLDGWARGAYQGDMRELSIRSGGVLEQRWEVVAHPRSVYSRTIGEGATPDEARAKAAAWIEAEALDAQDRRKMNAGSWNEGD